jgi:hypothetical protein
MSLTSKNPHRYTVTNTYVWCQTYLFGTQNGSIGCQHEMNARIWDEIGLKFVHIDIECTIKTQAGSQGGNDLSNQPIEIGVGGPFNVQIVTANIIQGFIVQTKGAVLFSKKEKNVK